MHGCPPDGPHCAVKTFPGFHNGMRRLFARYEVPVGSADMTKEHL
jgi:hypothetical protein